MGWLGRKTLTVTVWGTGKSRFSDPEIAVSNREYNPGSTVNVRDESVWAMMIRLTAQIVLKCLIQPEY